LSMVAKSCVGETRECSQSRDTNMEEALTAVDW
jgi:hypothetical protein